VDDAALLAAARAGDRAALEALLSRHERQIYRFGMKMCGDPEDAGEVLQETMLAMARSVKDFRGASSLSTWVYAIARSFCIKQRRRRKDAPEHVASLEAVSPSDLPPDPARSPEDEAASREITAALGRAIGRLDPEQREVLILRDVEGLTAPEVAEVLGVSAAAVKSRLHRARVAIRAVIAPMLGAERLRASACPDVVTLFSQHLEGDIGAETCAEMERHLAECPACGNACASLKRTLALCGSTPEAEVPETVREDVRRGLRAFLEGAA
jgi:RNA polymerase sigma-70 factor (ECF subfamily)